MPQCYTQNFFMPPTKEDLRDGFLMTAGLRPVANRDNERGEVLRGMTPLELCREGLSWYARKVPENEPDTIRTALSGGTVVADAFTGALGQAIAVGAAEAPDTTRGWCYETPVLNFKETTTLTINGSSSFKPLKRGGTAEHVDISIDGTSWKIARYAQQLFLEDQDLYDDTLRSLLLVARQMGAAASRLRPDLVYSLLLANAAIHDNVALFHADHGNLTTGGGSALSDNALEVGLAAVGNQRQIDGDGNPIHLGNQARFLVVPPSLVGTARRVTRNVALGDGNDLEVRSESRISATGVIDPATGTKQTGSATNWILAAPALAFPSVVVGYLDGQTSPTVRQFGTRDAQTYKLDYDSPPEYRGLVPAGIKSGIGPGQWGVGWDIIMDIGAAAVDYKSLYKAAGA